MPNDSVRAAATGLSAKISAENFAQFLNAMLSPVVAGEVVDFGYHRDMREARRGAWRRAASETGLHYARLKLLNAEEHWSAMRDLPHRGCTPRDGLATAWRAATAQQILTPAPDQAAVTWKRAAARLPCLPITKEAAADAIAADEAFLAAHPLTKAKSRHLSRP